MTSTHAIRCADGARPPNWRNHGRQEGGRVWRYWQANHGAGVLGDGLLFRPSKEDRRLGTIWRNGIRGEGKSVRRAEHFRHPRIRSRAELRQGYPGYPANSDGIHALANGNSWRAG